MDSYIVQQRNEFFSQLAYKVLTAAEKYKSRDVYTAYHNAKLTLNESDRAGIAWYNIKWYEFEKIIEIMSVCERNKNNYIARKPSWYKDDYQKAGYHK